jgi:hypothetical protein
VGMREGGPMCTTAADPLEDGRGFQQMGSLPRVRLGTRQIFFWVFSQFFFGKIHYLNSILKLGSEFFLYIFLIYFVSLFF